MWITTTPKDFDFRSAVCCHGFFVLAPNRWDPKHAILSTAVALDDASAVEVHLREADLGRIEAVWSRQLPRAQADRVGQAIRRMLRLDEDLSAFHRACRASTTHKQAAAMKFGRLLRSATLFEDVVKVICTCNVSWRQTVAMVRAIVAHWGVQTNENGAKAFPTPARLARVRADTLQKYGRVGYRARYISALARGVARGQIDLTTADQARLSSDASYAFFRTIPGVGDYAASHLCMLVGHYDRLAIDTEMRRLLAGRIPDPGPDRAGQARSGRLAARKQHLAARKRRLAARKQHLAARKWRLAARAAYAPWQPYAYLAYWYELWSDYVKTHGRSDFWSPADIADQITAKRARSG